LPEKPVLMPLFGRLSEVKGEIRWGLVLERTLFMNHARSPRIENPLGAVEPPMETNGSALGNLFKRKLDNDLIVRGDDWLRESGLQQQLEFEGYQLRWVTTNKLDVNLTDGWQYVTVPHYLWWFRRVRRRQGPRNQYLLKRVRSFR
jgi:hypothetical protein